MRAKFNCYNVETNGQVKVAYLSAVTSSNNEEDNQFADATPAGSLNITISNQSEEAQSFFKAGSNYYVDFSEAI